MCAFFVALWQAATQERSKTWANIINTKTTAFTSGNSSKRSCHGKGAASLGWPHKWIAPEKTCTNCLNARGLTPTCFFKSARHWTTTSSRSVPSIIKKTWTKILIFQRKTLHFSVTKVTHKILRVNGMCVILHYYGLTNIIPLWK